MRICICQTAQHRDIQCRLNQFHKFSCPVQFLSIKLLLATGFKDVKIAPLSMIINTSVMFNQIESVELQYNITMICIFLIYFTVFHAI